MYYNDFQGKKLSALGFGLMRLPTTPDGAIDQARFEKMVDYAIQNGVNYFDTAAPYHKGLSEIAAGKALAKYPRESYYLADKYPGHQYAETYDPKGCFENQLKKCGVDYFDFYLLHNVAESDIDVYLDPKWGIIDYFVEQRRLGRIKHLGFSSHAQVDTLERFLKLHGDKMEFCQIQLNYLDWTLQQAKEKYELLSRYQIPVWVMEPVRGGRLMKLDEEDVAALRALRPEESLPGWCFRWLQGLPNVTMVLSGMSELAQMEQNVATFARRVPTTEEENAALYRIADKLRSTVPCTACRYCCDGCPAGLDIPRLIRMYNDLMVNPSFNVTMLLDATPQDKWPSACIGCGQCSAICPQGIDVPGVLAAMSDKIKAMPSWAEICRQRALEAAQSQG